MSSSPVILAADIGGTHARFMLARSENDALVVLDEATLLVADHSSPEAAAGAFVERTGIGPIARACLAVAGPVEDRRARLTNAPWQVDADAIASRLRIPEVELCNDFEAAAFGLSTVPSTSRIVLHDAPVDTLRAASGRRRLLIGAGTGLGVAYVIGDGREQRIVAGEGGHVAFAPADDEQSELLAWLRPSLGRVEAEHLLSGPGLVRLYAFVCMRRGAVRGDFEREGPAAVSRRYAEGEVEAIEALRLFASIFGAVAGDHALSILPLDGVYVGGGLAPRFPRAFADGAFVRAFLDKAAHARLTARMPVFLLCDDRLGLRGAAARATMARAE